MRQGWKCPACLAVNGPHVDRCGCTESDSGRSRHYGVKYHSPWRSHPTLWVPGPAVGEGTLIPRLHALLACGSPWIGGDQYLVTADWNLVNCRRCLRSRVVAAGGPHAGPQCGSGSAYSRTALIGSAPAPTDGTDFVVGEPQLFEGHWNVPRNHDPYHCNHEPERCSHVWVEYLGNPPRCTLLAGHDGDHKPDR